jgi:hypothetical protein
LAANSEPRARRWTTGYGATPARRFSECFEVNGQADTANGLVASLNSTAGSRPPVPGRRRRSASADGSGWIIVQRADCQVTTADHCWFDKKTCTDGTETLEPNWIDPASTKPFSLERNADWVAETARRR